MSRVRAAANAFWRPPLTEGESEARYRLEAYQVGWGLYWNTAYDNLAAYANLYPPNHKIYKYMRGLRNPVGRWADFYVSNVWGGILDNEAGDGLNRTSSLPIETDVEGLQEAVAKLWQWSNWDGKRSVATLYTSVFGDAFIKVIDHPQSKRVYLQVRKPGEVVEMVKDDFGYIKYVVIEHDSVDKKGQKFVYREEIEHPDYWGGDGTKFSTYKDGALYAYTDNVDGGGQPVAEWQAPYDFVPMVHIPFIDIGDLWGATSYTKVIQKIDAANSKASQIADQIAKAVNTPLVIFGTQPGNVEFDTNQDDVPMLFIPNESAHIQQMLSDMNIDHALGSLSADLDEIKQDMPELRMSEALRSGMSGDALSRSFSDVMAQVQRVRSNHDAALVLAQMMAIAIGGEFDYAPAFAPFDLNSYEQGKLDHGIGSRPVLPRSEEEITDEQNKRWEQVSMATSAGVPLATALRDIMEWSDEQVAQMVSDQQQQYTFVTEEGF